MKNVYVILAMKRSGHHAFINWLCKQHGNVTNEQNSILGWERQEMMSAWNRRKVYGSGKDTVFNIEDFDMDDWANYSIGLFPCIAEADNIYPIVLLRDFRNWLASCLKRRTELGDRGDVYRLLDDYGYNDRKDYKPGRISLYQKQLYVGIHLYKQAVPNLITISYNDWFLHKEYRKKIAERLNILFTDKGFLEVLPHGGGSTFDGTSFDGRADQMKVLERWKEFEDDREMKSLLRKWHKLDNISEIYFNNEHFDKDI
jgi:hypothetical protein